MATEPIDAYVRTTVQTASPVPPHVAALAQELLDALLVEWGTVTISARDGRARSVRVEQTYPLQKDDPEGLDVSS